MSLSSTDKGLLATGNCAVIFVDHQPQVLSVNCIKKEGCTYG
jgi:hypothetical protein